MGFFIILVTLLFSVIVIVGILTKVDGEITNEVFVFFLFGLLASLLIAGVTSTIFQHTHEYSEEIKEATNIAALSNGSKSEGLFFLGIGSLEDNQVYYYMEETEDGMNLKNIDVSKVSVKEITDGATPNISTYSNRFKSGKLQFLFGDNMTTKRIISVPEGTVDRDFNVNLDN